MGKDIGEKEVKSILRKYDLGDYVSYRIFPKGVAQVNLDVRTSKGRYVLRKYRIRNLDYVKCEIDLLNYLHGKRFISQVPYKARNGKQHVLSYGKPILLLNYIDGEHIESKDISNENLRDISKLLGEYHKVINGFKSKLFSKREVTDAKYILSLFGDVRRNSKKRKKDMEVSLEMIKDRLKEIKFSKDLPKGFIHSDYHAGNILFDKGKISGVLDFDDGYYSYLIFDLADLLDNYVFDSRNDFAKARLIVKNYEKERKLTRVEKESLFDALRFRIMLFAVWHMGGNLKSLNVNRGMVKDTRKLLRIEKIGKEEFYRRIFLQS
tara:strand:+ start:307 stop:1272 length:966 start_codon:yes stop_codon:yes gene_type:complete